MLKDSKLFKRTANTRSYFKCAAEGMATMAQEELI